MKKVTSILILVFAVSFTMQAQKKREKKGPKMSTEQQAVLKVKKMTLALDLNTQQQREITPLISQQIEAKKNTFKVRESQKRPTKDEVFAMQNKRLDAQIMMKKKMKKILNKEQFEKFEKMAKKKRHKVVKKMKHLKGEKRREGKREGRKE